MLPKIPHQHPIRISFPISKVEKVRSGAREGGTNPNPNPNPNVENVMSGVREGGTNPNPNPNPNRN